MPVAGAQPGLVVAEKVHCLEEALVGLAELILKCFLSDEALLVTINSISRFIFNCVYACAHMHSCDSNKHVHLWRCMRVSVCLYVCVSFCVCMQEQEEVLGIVELELIGVVSLQKSSRHC